jgi:hypothetical protein
LSAAGKSRQLFLDQSREEICSNRQCSVVEIVMRVVDRTAADGAGVANIDESAGANLKHISKVPCRCNETSVSIYVRLADEISRNVGNELCLGKIIERSGSLFRRQSWCALTRSNETVSRLAFYRQRLYLRSRVVAAARGPRQTANCSDAERRLNF